MSYFYIGILILAAVITLKNEKNKKRKKIIGLIYTSILVIAFSYTSGEKIGKALYFYKNSTENIQEK